MNYNTLLVKYKNSWQLRTYQFTIKSEIDNELDAYDVFSISGKNSEGAKKSASFEKTEKEIDKAFAQFDEKYHFDNHSSYVSVNRSKNKIYYYSRSNDWVNGYFCTFTIDPKRYDPFDYSEVSKMIRSFNDFLRHYNSCIYALFVPEKHKSGAFHLHGIVSEGLKDFLVYSGHDVKGEKIYNCKAWKYGFSNCTKVKNALAIEKYICKYTSKELLNDTKYQHRYFILNLQQAEEIKLNLLDHDDLYKELCANGLVHFCNTSGLYNRVNYCEIKNCEKTLQIIEKYVNITKEFLSR